MNTRALPQRSLHGLYQHRGPLQQAGHLRLRGVVHHLKARWVWAQAQPTQASKVIPVRTKTALRKLPKAELEEEMRQLSLDNQGTKPELVDRLYAYLAAQEAKEIPEDTPVADKAPDAPEGWLFEAEAEDGDLPPDIKALLEQQAEEEQMRKTQDGDLPPDIRALLEQQAEEEQMGSTQDRGQEELETQSSMIFGASNSPEDLQALPKKELQEKLAQRGLPKSGNKAELAKRLHAALTEEQEVVLQDQVEAQYELQRQFQESMMNPTSRMGADDRQEFLDPASGIPEESIDQWAIDIEAEYQSPDDNAELSLEDAEAAGATPGAVRDEEGGVLRGRFNRPHAPMDLFEYQGTKAAELAGEDYAAQHRGGAEQSQALTGDSSVSQQRMATPIDSQDEGDLFHISMADGDAEGEDDDGYENDIDNDLEDGFSMAAGEEGDGFDPDVEEDDAKEAEGRSMPSSRQASRSGYVGHRNYDSLSSRSPDDIEEDFELLDTIISAASTEPSPAVLNVQRASTTIHSPLNLSRRDPKLQGSKPGRSAATVVASQGTSSLDYGTAKDWMSTRLPEAMRLGITPDQLVSEAASLQSQTESAETASDGSSAFSTGSSEAADRSGRDRRGQLEDEEHVGSMPEAAEAQHQAEPLVEQELADTEAASEPMAFHLDTDLLDELAEGVLGQPEDTAAAQLTSTLPGSEQELDDAEALTGAASVGGGESTTAGTLSVMEGPASPLAGSGVQAETEPEELTPKAATEHALTARGGAAAAEPEAASPMPNTSKLSAAEAPQTLPAQGDQEMMVSSAGARSDEQEREADELVTQLLSEDGAMEAATESSDGFEEHQIADESGLPSALMETQTGSGYAPEMQDTIIPSEQLESIIDNVSEAVASGSMSPSHLAATEVALEPQGVDLAADSLSDTYQVPDNIAEPLSHSTADVLNGSAEAQSGELLSLGQPTLAQDQQELAALRVEMAQKQGALAALQSQVAAVGRSNEGNTAQIAQLQVAMASLQSQRLDLQRANLSGRLSVLQDIAVQASLNAAAKEDLQQQLQSMRDELTQLETDLSSRDTEAADLSRKLAHARTKLGDPTAATPANGHARASVPGEMRARLGKSDGFAVGGQHTLEEDNAPPQQSAERVKDDQSGTEKMKKTTTQPGVVVAAGLLGAFKAIGGMFKWTRRDEQK